jgi:hypothetical protein
MGKVLRSCSGAFHFLGALGPTRGETYGTANSRTTRPFGHPSLPVEP